MNKLKNKILSSFILTAITLSATGRMVLSIEEEATNILERAEGVKGLTTPREAKKERKADRRFLRKIKNMLAKRDRTRKDGFRMKRENAQIVD